MKCKVCSTSFYTKVGGDVCQECKIDRFYTRGDCIFCNRHLELDVEEGLCVHELPGCHALMSCTNIREFALLIIETYESKGLRVFQKQSTLKIDKRLLND